MGQATSKGLSDHLVPSPAEGARWESGEHGEETIQRRREHVWQRSWRRCCCNRHDYDSMQVYVCSHGINECSSEMRAPAVLSFSHWVPLALSLFACLSVEQIFTFRLFSVVGGPFHLLCRLRLQVCEREVGSGRALVRATSPHSPA